MHILLINWDLPLLPGHTCHPISIRQGGIFSLQRLLKRQGTLPKNVQPDLILQKESLGTRVIFRDLASFPCPKIFWSIDSHLNLFWQHWYAQLFDLVLSPHPSLWRKLPVSWAHKYTSSFPYPGYARRFTPHSQRPRDAVFVGIIDENRIQRKRFAEFLAAEHGVCPQRLPFLKMLELYETSRLLPNESIGREFNFRIMEGASCGCCVLTEDIGEDLEANFTVGQEVLTYRQIRELHELICFLKSRPALTEKIGHSAWLRVQKEHLPEHRLQQLESFANSLSAQSLDQESGQRLAILSAVQASRGDGLAAATLAELSRLLETLSPHPDVMAMGLRLATEAGDFDKVRAQLKDLLAEYRPSKPPLDLALAIYCASFRLRDKAQLQVAKNLLVQHLPNPSTLSDQCFPLALADLLVREQRICQPGFRFDPKRHCPETALELLLMCEACDDSLPPRLLQKKVADLACHIPFTTLNKTYCQRVADATPGSWPAAFEAGLRCLESFAASEGQKYLQKAHTLAQAEGQEDVFRKRLADAGLSAP